MQCAEEIVLISQCIVTSDGSSLWADFAERRCSENVNLYSKQRQGRATEFRSRRALQCEWST